MDAVPKSKVTVFFTWLNGFLIYFNLFFLQFYLIRFSLGPYPTNVQEILIVLNAIVFLLLFLFRHKAFKLIKHLKKHSFILSLFLLTLISALSVGWIQSVDFLRYLKFLFFSSALVFMALETFQSSEERRSLLRVAGRGAVVFGLFSVAWNLLGHNVAYDHRLTGPLDSAVYLAYYLTPFFIFFVIDWLQFKPKQNLIYIFLLFFLMLATQSVGAIAASILILAFFILKNKPLTFFQKKWVRFVLIISSVLMMGIAFYVKILPAFQHASSSLGERFEIWQTAFALLKQPFYFIFGVGFGQFQAQYATHVLSVLRHDPLDYNVLQPHNIFLLFWMHFGLLGVLLLIYLFWKTIKTMISPLQKESVSQVASFVLAYFLIHGMIDTPFFKNDLLILFILFAQMSWSKQEFLEAPAHSSLNPHSSSHEAHSSQK